MKWKWKHKIPETQWRQKREGSSKLQLPTFKKPDFK